MLRLFSGCPVSEHASNSFLFLHPHLEAQGQAAAASGLACWVGRLQEMPVETG